MSAVTHCVVKLSTGKHVTPVEVKAALEEIMANAATEAQIGGFLMGLRGEFLTPEVLAACADVMLEKSIPCSGFASANEAHLVMDIVGTGEFLSALQFAKQFTSVWTDYSVLGFLPSSCAYQRRWGRSRHFQCLHSSRACDGVVWSNCGQARKPISFRQRWREF
jgi:hypothetical protein